jgi:hypothetical protein
MIPYPSFIDLDHLTHWILVTHRLLLQSMKKPSIPKERKIPDVILNDWLYQFSGSQPISENRDHLCGRF